MDGWTSSYILQRQYETHLVAIHLHFRHQTHVVRDVSANTVEESPDFFAPKFKISSRLSRDPHRTKMNHKVEILSSASTFQTSSTIMTTIPKQDMILSRSRLLVEHTIKRIRFMEPDVIVNVGSKSFPHYSIVLCMASPYFDAMLSCDMKEKETMSIDLPGKNPDDWELLLPFLEARVSAQDVDLDMDKIPRLLPLFHEFQMDSMIKECDDLCSAYLKMGTRDEHPDDTPGFANSKDIFPFVELLATVHGQYLTKSTATLLTAMDNYFLNKNSDILDEDLLMVLRPLFALHSVLWNALAAHLPVKLVSKKEDLLKNPLFEHIVAPFLKTENRFFVENPARLHAAFEEGVRSVQQRQGKGQVTLVQQRPMQLGQQTQGRRPSQHYPSLLMDVGVAPPPQFFQQPSYGGLRPMN
jgi:hypothetical protein